MRLTKIILKKYAMKMIADIYIYDRNIGGLPIWGEIYNMICPEEEIIPVKIKKSWWKG